jgi:peptidoglycan/LPS O-acetylase OafA/YrhL
MTETKAQPLRVKTGYLPSLDGWRALAILGVLMAHDLPWTIAGHSNAAFKSYGGIGVNLFFAISGILITWRILEEERICGLFDIRRFYIRRVFRIQPAALAYLSVIALLTALAIIHIHWVYWWGALLLFENFQYRGPSMEAVSFFTGHFWTLAVEEHFYILLSLLLFFVRGRGRRIGALVLLYVGLYFAQELATMHGLYDDVASLRRTYWQLDYLLFPALLAVLLQRQAWRDMAQRYLRPWVAFAATIAIVLLHGTVGHLRHPASAILLSPDGLKAAVGLCIRFFFAIWVVATMLHPGSWTTRALELRPLRFIGRISYSLYLWHMLFIFRLVPATDVSNPVLLALSGRPMKYIAAFGIATLSYYLLEKPLIRMGHKLAPPATPGRLELADLPVEVPLHGTRA